jgi:hypothetical protein
VTFKLPTVDPSDPSGVEVDHEATASALERELVGWGASVGFGGGNFAPGPFGQFWRVRRVPINLWAASSNLLLPSFCCRVCNTATSRSCFSLQLIMNTF